MIYSEVTANVLQALKEEGYNTCLEGYKKDSILTACEELFSTKILKRLTKPKLLLLLSTALNINSNRSISQEDFNIIESLMQWLESKITYLEAIGTEDDMEDALLCKEILERFKDFIGTPQLADKAIVNYNDATRYMLERRATKSK